MIVISLKRPCLCHDGHEFHWLTLDKREIHRYRVQCGNCQRFIKWGSEAELAMLQMTDIAISVVQFKPPRPPDTIMDMFE